MSAAFRYIAILLLSLTAVCACAQGRPPHRPRGILELALVPEVQKELKLDDGRVAELRAARVTLEEKARGDRSVIMGLSPEEREKRFQAFRAEVERKVAELLDPQQMRRLKQLDLQLWGIRGLIRQDVQERLHLSPEQRAQVQSIMSDERNSIRTVFGDFRGGKELTPEQRAELRKKFDAMRDVQTQAEAKLNAVLSDHQQKHFRWMQGPPFKFPDFHSRPPGGA